MKRKNIMILLIVLLCVVAGCKDNKTKSNISNNILSINGAKVEAQYICDNSQHTYIYQMVDNVCGIYEYKTGELLIPIENSIFFQFMAASDSCVAYYSSENYGTLFIYSAEDNSLINKIEHIDIYTMKGDKDYIFVSAKEQGGSNSDVMVVADDGYIWLREQLDNEGRESSRGDYINYQWNDYDVAVSGEEIIYIEKNDFELSISVNANYVKSKDMIYTIEKQPEFLQNKNGGHGGISAKMISEKDGICYFIAQYSEREYCENPSVDFVKGSVLCSYSLEDGAFDVLYEATEDEQIVGFSNDKKELFIATESGLIKRNLGTNEEKLLLANKYKNNTDRVNYYYESYGQGIVVFSDNVQRGNGPVYEGFYE